MLSTRSLLFVTSLLGLLAAPAVACGTDAGGTFDDGDGGGASGGSGTSSGTLGIGSGSDGSTPERDGSSGSAGPSCATAEATAAREPVYLHVVLDRSQSMDGHGSKTGAGNVCDPGQTPPGDSSVCFLQGKREPDPLMPGRTINVCHKPSSDPQTDCPAFIGLTGKKWLAARGALTAYFDSAATAAEPRLGVGMFLFDGETTSESTWKVAPGVVDATQLAALRATVLPPEFATRGGTPLRAALTSQSAQLRAFQPQAPLLAGGKRVLVVMTDGTPGDCGAGRSGCVEDVAALRTGEPAITTFVIGVGDVDDEEGSVYDEKFLSRLANAGGAGPEGCNPDWDGENPQGTTACHFQVTPGAKSAAEIRDEMTEAFGKIASRVQSCELTLAKTSPIDPAKVNVIYTDKAGAETQIAPGENGWSYDNPQDPSKVILSGSACQQLKADRDATVRIVIGCPTGTTVVN